jgi:hypothetical protein
VQVGHYRLGGKGVTTLVELSLERVRCSSQHRHEASGGRKMLVAPNGGGSLPCCVLKLDEEERLNSISNYQAWARLP